MANVRSEASTQLFRTYQTECMECVKQLYLDTETADVRFSFGTKNDPRAQIAAHKILLAATSDVFKSMFYGKMKETGNIHVPDVSDAAFMEFLQYFYLNEVKLSAEHIDAVLYLGQKYHVKKCIIDCLAFSANLIDDENVCSCLHVAIEHKQLELIKRCEKRILVNTVEIFKSTGFLTCDRRVLTHILKMKQFSCSEVKVFEAMMSWVKAKCKQDVLTKELIKAHIGNLFYEIRFASMKIEEFCALAKKYDLILSSNFKTIANMIVLPDLRNEETCRFSTSPRQIEWNNDAIVTCNREIGNEKTYKLDVEQLTIFSTNEPLLLGNFTCAKTMVKESLGDQTSDLMVEVKIGEFRDFNSQNISGVVLVKTVAKLQSEKTIVSLSQPILIRPGFFYLIEIGPFPKAHYFCSTELKKEVDLDSDIAIEFHKCAKTGTDKRIVGFIPVMDFNRI